MKEFEKWWSAELSEEEAVKIKSNMALTIPEKVDRLAKEGWKAALRWVYSYDYGADDDMTAFDLIEKELEDK